MLNDEGIKQWVEVFSALASEPRLKIVEMLSSGKMECQEILERLELSQPAVSYHLGKLERAGILIKQRNGSRNCYRLRKSVSKFIKILEKEEKE